MITIYIYGLFCVKGICYYVGQTGDVKRRWYTLKTDKRFKHLNLEMRVLRKTTYLDAYRLEGQIQSAYKRKGQAKLNRQIEWHKISSRWARKIFAESVK